MTPVQVRMARAGLGLSLDELAAQADMPVAALRAQEAGPGPGDPAGAARLRATLERLGIELIDADGVRMPASNGLGTAEVVPLDQLNSANDE